jgi:hypothetical protein
MFDLSASVDVLQSSFLFIANASSRTVSLSHGSESVSLLLLGVALFSLAAVVRRLASPTRGWGGTAAARLRGISRRLVSPFEKVGAHRLESPSGTNSVSCTAKASL